jgi:2-dehydropantoate 2-reductase
MVNPTSAMTGVAGYDLKFDEAARKVILNLGYEAVKVGRLLGFDVPVPIGSGYDLDDLKRAATEGYEELEADFVGKPATIPGRPSMAQDVMKGRRTEVEYLNGLVSENGRRIGFPTPYCDAAVSVIKGIEAGEFEVGWENIQRMVSMVSASRKR